MTDEKMTEKERTKNLLRGLLERLVSTGGQSNQDNNLNVSEKHNSFFAVLRPEAMASDQTSYSSSAYVTSKPMISNAGSDSVYSLCSSQSFLHQKKFKGYTEDADHTKRYRNDTEIEIERLKKIIEAQNRFKKRIEILLGQKKGSKRQNKHPKSQEEKSKGQELGSYQREVRSGKHDDVQIQDENANERKITLTERPSLELKETLEEQGERIMTRKTESNDQFVRVKKEMQKIVETSKVQMNVLEEGEKALKREKMSRGQKLNRKEHDEDSNCHDKVSECQKEQHSDTGITDNPEYSDIYILKQQNYDKNRHILDKKETDKEDIVKFKNDLTDETKRDNPRAQYHDNIHDRKLMSRKSSNKTEELNSGGDMLPKEIILGSTLEFSRNKRNEILDDIEINLGHSQKHAGELKNKENSVFHADDEKEKPGDIINACVHNSLTDYRQPLTRIKPSSKQCDSIDSNQVNNEPMYKRGTSLEMDFPKDADEDEFSYSLHYSHHTHSSNQSNISGDTGELSQSETVYKSNIDYTNLENESSSLLPPQRRNESSYSDQHLNIQQWKCPVQDQANVNSSSGYSDNDLRTDMVSSLNALAEHLGFIVKDVIPDGNCMFSAIVDQLRISGNLDFTPQTLRSAAVSQLRNNPINKDGTHMESFLDMESWETYLTRMAQECVWGDHMALQACVEVTGYRIHVIKYPLVITKLEPTSTEVDEYSVLYLGHFSESHFVSLRQKDWEETWHIKAKVKKLQKEFPRIFKCLMKKEVTIKGTKINDLITVIKCMKVMMRKVECQIDVEEQKEQGDVKLPNMNQGYIVDELEMTSQLPEDSGKEGIELPTESEWEELENWLRFNKEPGCGLTQDKFTIDAKTGTSLLHISFLVKFYIKDEYLIHVYNPNKSTEVWKVIGSVPEGLRYSFRHYQKVSKRNCYCEKMNLQMNNVYIDSKSQVFVKEADSMQMTDLLSETELCYPGYTLLCPCDLSKWKKDLYYINGQKPVLRRNNFVFGSHTCTVFTCASWPELTQDWMSRYRSSGWPNKEHIEAMKMSKCLAVPVPHANSALPECEWQFIFPDAEQILTKDCMSQTQKCCFKVFKVIVDFHLQNGLVRLSTTHLKTVMYYACEVVPTSCWSENIGGCVLYLLERLGICLSEKNLPNYFIKENNMIEHFTKEQISWAKEKVLTLRLFPVLSIIHIADHHGFEVQAINSVIADIKVFERDRDANKAIHDVFVPTLVAIATDLVISERYNMASIFFQDAYDEMLEAPKVSGYMKLDDGIPSFRNFLLEILNKETDDYLRDYLTYTFNTYCGTHFGYKNK